MRQRIVLAGVVLSLLCSAGAARACSCTESPSPAEALREADAVVRAEVESVRQVGFDLEVDLFVLQSWKGVQTQRVVVRTFPDEGLCGFPFRTGGEYLVYANDIAPFGSPQRLSTSLCSRTRPIDEAEEDLAYLGRGSIVGTDASTWSGLKARFD